MNLIKLDLEPEPRAYKLLIAGSASGELVGALRARGVDARLGHRRIVRSMRQHAEGVEEVQTAWVDHRPSSSRMASSTSSTKPASATSATSRSRQGDRRAQPGDPQRGLIFGWITSDLSAPLIDKYNLLRGVKKLGTWWEWSELFFSNGFDLSMHRRDVTDALWEATLAANKGPGTGTRTSQSALLVLRQGCRYD